jgi:hypothetical protein
MIPAVGGGRDDVEGDYFGGAAFDEALAYEAGASGDYAY